MAAEAVSMRYLSPARVTYLTRERARVRAYGEVV
jgi:hypothetical protein